MPAFAGIGGFRFGTKNNRSLGSQPSTLCHEKRPTRSSRPTSDVICWSVDEVLPSKPMTESLAIFLRQVRSRSQEHQKAMELLSTNRLAGQMVSVLRQELDSMVRVIYLLAQNPSRRQSLIDMSIRGERWTRETSRDHVTDREMVELSQSLHGWTRSVYKFGCAFIHLSSLHDYSDRDPLLSLPAKEREDILAHCRHYHGGPAVGTEHFANLIPYLPLVLQKVADNLEHYLIKLENGDIQSVQYL